MSIPRFKFIFAGAMTALLMITGVAYAKADEPQTAAKAATPAAETAKKPVKKSNSTADHSKFKELDKDFKTGPDVTKACLECHTEAAKQVQHTKHWTWEWINPQTKQKLGKKNIINNFCTSVQSNQTFCTALAGVMIALTLPIRTTLIVSSVTIPRASTRKSLAYPVIRTTRQWNGHHIPVTSARPPI